MLYLARALCYCTLFLAAAFAPAEQWTIFKPGNTGIGGSQIEGFRLDPQGRPWVGSRYPVQEDGGAAMFDGVKWANFSTVDNLMPSEFVYCMAFAADGSRWFGSDVGLVHHFGDHFTLYNSANSPLPKNFIRSIQIDGVGRVWMVYWDPLYISTGVAMFDGTTWKIWPNDTGLGLSAFTKLDKIAVGPNGNVWVGTDSGLGLGRWDGSKWTRVLPGSGATAPFNPYLGRDGRIWVLAGSDVRVFSGTSWIIKPLPFTNGVEWRSLHAMSDGTYFVGNWQGTLAYNGAGGWQSMTTPSDVESIESNSAGELWWVSLKRLYKFVSWGKWKVFHSGNTGLTEYFTNSLTFDNAGHLWVGTSGGGACSFDGQVWKGFNPYNDGSEPWGLPTDFVPEILGASDSSIWIATGNGAARFDGTSWAQYGYGFLKNDIAQGPDGSVYATWDINTDNGLAKFNGSDFVRTSLIGAPVYGGEPYDVYVDPMGKLYVGTATGLLSNESGAWVRTDMNAIAGGAYSAAFCITKAPNGDLFVGTANGLARRRNGAWTVFRESNSGVPANIITSVAVRGDGLLAVGAFDGNLWPYHGGVSTFDGSTWLKRSYSNSSIQHEQVEDVKFDPAGNLWIVSQSEGIARIRLGTGTGSVLNSLVILPNALAGGLSASARVTLSGPAPAGGVTVTLASDSILATVPSVLLIPEGATSNTAPVKTTKVSSDMAVAISASSNGVTRSAPITLQFNAAGYYGQSVPLTMNAGQKYNVQITYRNMGSSTWSDGAGFRLASRNPADNKNFGINRLRMNPFLYAAPGELGNFMGTITAPLVPGTYLWQWKPLLNGVGTFGEESPIYSIKVIAPANNAKFVSQTVPLSVKAGAMFSASVTMQNTGTETWSNALGYRLQSRNPTDNTQWGTNRMYLPSGVTVAPGASFTFTRIFTAPATTGTYNFQWKMLLNGYGSFGEQSSNQVISVVP